MPIRRGSEKHVHWERKQKSVANSILLNEIIFLKRFPILRFIHCLVGVVEANVVRQSRSPLLE